MQKLSQTIESLLFVLGEATSFKRLAKLTGASVDEVTHATQELNEALKERGIRLVYTNDAVGLVTAPESASIVSVVMKEEFSGDLSKAAVETLSIVVYKGPLSRPDIDYVRGVNSSFTLRNLLVRGLVERAPHPKDARSYVYKPSLDLLKYLGVSRVEDIPEYERVKEEFSHHNIEKEQKNEAPTESLDRAQDKESSDNDDQRGEKAASKHVL